MSPLLVRRIVTTSLIAVLFLATPSYSRGLLANTVVHRLSLKDQPLSSVILNLAITTNVPIGLEMIPNSDDPRISVDAIDSTLAVELDKLVLKNTRYQWKQLGQMINVFPISGGGSVFDVVTDRLEASDTTPIQMVRQLIHQPAVALYLSKKKIVAATWVAGSVPLERFSVRIEKLSFREALNQVVLSTNGLGWIGFHMNQAKTDTLYFQLW